jgi:hypothetical protein
MTCWLCADRGGHVRLTVGKMEATVLGHACGSVSAPASNGSAPSSAIGHVFVGRPCLAADELASIAGHQRGTSAAAF